MPPCISREMVIAEGNRLLARKGRTFEVAPHMERALAYLMAHFNPSATFPKPRQSFVIYGNPGSGKTTLMRIFNKLARKEDQATFYDARELAKDFAAKGWEAIAAINQARKEGGLLNHVWIDDMGTERPTMHTVGGFSKTEMTDLMLDVVHKTDLKFDKCGAFLYVTTNLGKGEMATRYADARTASRMNELDWIPCGTDESDRDFRVNN